MHNVVTDDAGEHESLDLECMPMFHISDQGELKSKSVPSYKLEIAVNDVPVVMEIDTGSGISIISVHDFESLGVSRINLTKPSVRMTGFSGAEIKCIGEGKFNVSIDGVEKPTLLRVVDNGGPSLLGRDMLSQFTLPWKQIVNVNHVQMDGRRRALIEEFEELFDTTQVGKLRSAQITLRVDDSDPIFHKARPVPFSSRRSTRRLWRNWKQRELFAKLSTRNGHRLLCQYRNRIIVSEFVLITLAQSMPSLIWSTTRYLLLRKC